MIKESSPGLSSLLIAVLRIGDRLISISSVGIKIIMPGPGLSERTKSWSEDAIMSLLVGVMGSSQKTIRHDCGVEGMVSGNLTLGLIHTG